MNKDQKFLIQKVKNALAEEQDILVNGEFRKLSDFLEKKKALLSEVSALSTSIPSEALKDIESIASHNQRLYSASLRGLAAAKARLEELREAVGSLKTYSSKGQVNSEDTSAPTLFIKA